MNKANAKKTRLQRMVIAGALLLLGHGAFSLWALPSLLGKREVFPFFDWNLYPGKSKSLDYSAHLIKVDGQIANCELFSCLNLLGKRRWKSQYRLLQRFGRHIDGNKSTKRVRDQFERSLFSQVKSVEYELVRRPFNSSGLIFPMKIPHQRIKRFRYSVD